MLNTFHLHIKKEYAAALIEDLIKVEAVELVEDISIELTQAQKAALDIELSAIKSNPDYLLKWADVKHKYKKA
ncbi:MAG: hypothetical protein JWR72_2947 [Flavisolibacter sp.]|nr:hypothetical protein [Flavisolibacter sp.]